MSRIGKIRWGLAIVIFIVIIVCLLTGWSPLGADDAYENYQTGRDQVSSVYGAAWFGQTFTPSIGHYVTSVSIYCYRFGSPGTVTVGIRATSGGVPTGSDIAVGTRNGNDFTTSAPGDWYNFTLGTAVELQASTQYAIVVRVTGGDEPRDHNLTFTKQYSHVTPLTNRTAQ